jgi:hypothetical protein
MYYRFLNDTASTRGNAIIEYTMIGVLVISVAVVALTALGDDFDEQLGGVFSSAKQQSEKAAFAEAQVRAAAAIAAVTNGPGSRLPSTSGEFSMSQDGLVQTTGAGGSTMNTAEQGSTDTSNTADANIPDAEEQLKQLLTELANEAHQIAYLQSLLESISQYSQGDMTKLQSSLIFYNGRLVNAYQLSYALSNGGAIIALENKKNEVLSSSASEEVRDAITDLTTQIKESALTTSAQAKKGVDGPKQSEETHKNAANICEQGGGTDIGTQCGV